MTPQNAGHNNVSCRRLTMNKYIGFDADSKRTVARAAHKAFQSAVAGAYLTEETLSVHVQSQR